MKLKLSKKNDIYAKLFSLITAIFLWIFIDNIININKSINLPVYLINIPKNTQIYNLNKQKVNVKLKVNKENIGSINLKNIQAIIDLKNITEGTNTYRVRINRKKLPNSVSIISYNPKKYIVIYNKKESIIDIRRVSK